MNERNVEALAEIASSFAIEEAHELAEHLAAQGVLACDTITDRFVLEIIIPKLAARLVPSANSGTVMRTTLVAYANGKLVGY